MIILQAQHAQRHSLWLRTNLTNTTRRREGGGLQYLYEELV